jgi:hypothetical protein
MSRAFALVALSGCLAEPGAPGGRARAWREVSKANQPGALHSPRMTWDKTRKSVVLHGGVTVDGSVRTTWELTDDYVWTEICPTTVLPALYSPAFAFDPVAERLVIAGGSSTPDYLSPSTEVWTCSSTAPAATWVPHPIPLPRALVGAQLVYDDARGIMVITGGNNETGTSSRESFATSDLQAWDPLGIASPAAFGGAATNITYDNRNERILALKNYTTGVGGLGEATNELWQLPKSAGNWSLICGSAMQACQWEARSEAALAHLGESLATFAIGGSSGGPRGELAGSWILDNGELVQSHDDPPARARAGVGYDNDRQELIVYGGTGTGCRGAGGYCDTTWILDLE